MMEEGERPDLIMNLPYEILKLIVSLIPLKEAIRTSILSSTWKRLWSPLQVLLEINTLTSLEANQLIKQIMATFLSSYDHSPQLLKLSLVNPKTLNDVEKLFFIAIKGVNKELHLDNFLGEKRGFTLSLGLVCLNSCHKHFFSLKILHLRSVTKLATNFVSALFPSCPVLETFNLEKCSGLKDIDVKANDCLQKFEVLDCENMVSITISAPNLKSFSYRGVLPKIQLKTTLNLFDVSLYMKDGVGHNEFDCEDILSLLASLKDVEILTLSGWLLEWLCSAGVIFERLEFKFNKLKEFWWIDPSMDKQKRDSLACFLNITPSLEKLYVNIDENYSPVPCPMFHQYWHEPHLWMDYATVKANASQLKHLKMVKLVGFMMKEEEDQVLLMDLLLERANSLKTMTVCTYDNCLSWWVAKVPCSHLTKISSCHSSNLRLVSSRKSDCCFVLTEENNYCL